MSTVELPIKVARAPVCVDLDGTLVRSDVLLELILQLVRRRPLLIFQIVVWALQGRSVLKTRVADRATLDPSLLPYNAGVVEIIRREQRSGGTVYLVTGAAAAVANAVASHLGCFDGVIALERGMPNFTGRAKRDELVRRFGQRGFRYIGNSGADLPCWKSAREVIVVEPTITARAAILAGRLNPHRILARRWLAREFVRALRPWQWAKNVLIFVPLVCSHQYGNQSVLLRAVVCFCAFCLATSSVYLTNDLLDLEADRRDARKRRRPFAAGDLPVSVGLISAPLLFAASMLIALPAGIKVCAVIVAYITLAITYSLKGKRVAIADVILLSGFYTLRVFLGGIATGVSISPWLAVLSMFLFLSMAIAKRHSELVCRGESRDAVVPGRDYRASDAPVLLGLGISCGNLAALVLALYVRSDVGAALYSNPEWLYGLAPLLIFWLGRMWLVSGRGQLDADPLMFTLHDRTSWVLLMAGGLMAGLAGPH
jgi:4-hydroxybenzoate polyprenyltransferase/phosphoserine phosphatase